MVTIRSDSLKCLSLHIQTIGYLNVDELGVKVFSFDEGLRRWEFNPGPVLKDSLCFVRGNVIP